MLVCTAIFCVQLLLPLAYMEGLFGLWSVDSGRFWPWQPITYAFLHSTDGPMHLAFNMFGLWMFGGELENLWGRKRYLHLLLASVLTAAATQIVVMLLGFGGSYTVGASGALFGLLLSFGMLFPNRIIVPLIPPIPMKARTFVAIFGGLELVLGFVNRGNVAHFAHLGGMLGAWLMISYWRGRLPFGGKRRR